MQAGVSVTFCVFSEVIFTHSCILKGRDWRGNCPLWCPEYPDQYFTSQTGTLEENRRAGRELVPGQWGWKEVLASWGFRIAFHHLVTPEHFNNRYGL
jgi:hypothetical protein